ncbi:MAG: hypothetical protein Q8S06_08415 [Methanobacteriaceae archaeon]|nr:hypothetical protein [Methanobacteriaceae archaeon]
MEPSHKKIIAAGFMLTAALMSYLSTITSPEVYICWAGVFAITGIFEYKRFLNSAVYWSLISVFLVLTLIITYFLSPPYPGNELSYYFLIGISVIILAWYLFRPIQNLEEVIK